MGLELINDFPRIRLPHFHANLLGRGDKIGQTDSRIFPRLKNIICLFFLFIYLLFYFFQKF